MARARQLKPGFFKNEDLARCTPWARLMFEGLWTLSDREGRLEDRPTYIKGEIFPHDNVDPEVLLAELAAATDHMGRPAFILRYEIRAVHYIQIINFVKHQQPHYKEVPSLIPPPAKWRDSPNVALAVPESLRIAVIERDGKKCLNCGNSRDLTVDHVIPRSRGGTSDSSNLQTLCRKCNSAKNNRDSSMSAQGRPDIEPRSARGRPKAPSQTGCLTPPSFLFPLPSSLTPSSLTPSSLTPSSLTPSSLTPDSPLPGSGASTGHAPAKKFTPPTAEEVQAYLDELGERRFSGEAFVDAYQVTGWKTKGGEPIKDWPAAVRNWRHMRDQRGEVQATPKGKPEVLCRDCHEPMTNPEMMESTRCRACRQEHGV